jgi:hypothetical protein
LKATYFFGAIEIDGFIDKDEFKKQIDEWIRILRSTNPLPAPAARSSGRPGARSRSDPEQRSSPAAQKRRNPKITL